MFEVAVAEFNRRARADSTGRLQPPLTEKELLASILGWVNKPAEFPDSVFNVFQALAAKGQLPRGSYLEFVRGLVDVNHADTDVWWIDLRASLDQYPSDLVGVPIYRHRVRTTYLESHRHGLGLHEGGE